MFYRWAFCFQVGVPSNIYALYHAAVQLKQKNELGVYLMNLTVSDLLYLTSLPLWLQYIFQVSRSSTGSFWLEPFRTNTQKLSNHDDRVLNGRETDTSYQG